MRIVERELYVSMVPSTENQVNKFRDNKHLVGLDSTIYNDGRYNVEATFRGVDRILEHDDLIIFFEDGEVIAIPANIVECYTLSMGTRV